MADVLDPTQWPRYMFHTTEPPRLVGTPDAEAALDEGWKRTPYSDDEKLALLRTDVQARKERGVQVAAGMETPVTSDEIAARQDEQTVLKKAQARETRKARYERDKRRREADAAYTVAPDATPRRQHRRRS
jgi:hypothetical protein